MRWCVLASNKAVLAALPEQIHATRTSCTDHKYCLVRSLFLDAHRSHLPWGAAVRPTFPFPFPLSFLESAINFDDATVRCSSSCSWSSAQPTEHHIFDVIPFCSFLEYKKPPPPLSISTEYTIRRLESRKRRPLLKMRALVLLYAMHST